MRPLKLQLGHVIERYVEIERSAQMVKIRHFLTFLPVRSLENDNDHPHLVVWLDIENSTMKKSHISLKKSPRAAESWKRTYLEVWGFYPWIFTFRLNYSQQCQIFRVTDCGCQRPTSKPKMKPMRPLTLQLGHVIEKYVEIERSAQMVKIRHFLTFLPVRSLENDNDHPHLVVWLDIENSTMKKSHISLKNSPRDAESW